MTVNYKFKTEPYQHQREALGRSITKQNFGFFMEMGAGKSKVLIDTIATLADQGRIDFALIIAPKGVYGNWIRKEIPEHFSDDVYHRVIQWHANPNKTQQAEMAQLREPRPGVLTIFVMNVEAFSTPKGIKTGEWVAKRYGARGLIGIDESTTIKNPKAKRTKALCKISQGFRYRRLLTGSPVTKNPLDIYAQAAFLDPNLLGYSSYFAFQARYAVLQKRTMGAHSFQQIVGYRNIDELSERISEWSYRVLKEECLDLPEKIYTTRSVPLTADQVRHYNQLRNDAFTFVEEGGLVSAQEVITKMLRMQQVLAGHLKTDDDEMIDIPTKRIDTVLDCIEETDGKVILWSRFRYEMRALKDALEKAHGPGTAAMYFGDTPTAERQDIVRRFQAPNDPLRFFVSNKTGAYGITLTAANTVIYVSNDFDLETRVQSEDRAHRIGQRKPVTYIDLIAEDTIDERIVQALRNKMVMSAQVLGEEAREWLKLTPKKS